MENNINVNSEKRELLEYKIEKLMNEWRKKTQGLNLKGFICKIENINIYLITNWEHIQGINETNDKNIEDNYFLLGGYHLYFWNSLSTRKLLKILENFNIGVLNIKKQIIENDENDENFENYIKYFNDLLKISNLSTTT